MTTGLVLLTGGASRRFGAPKHLQRHPDGGSWAGHLVRVFREALGAGPVRILGPGAPDYPECPALPDEGAGPARALAAWASGEGEHCARWWIAPCDQVGWTLPRLAAWHRAACAADPAGVAWVAAVQGGCAQPLGGFLGGSLLPLLGAADEVRMRFLWEQLPHTGIPWEGDAFADVDDTEAWEAWCSGRIRGG
jgi:molybdopterin-guanine dinucleotide biosynthesis protein A